MATIWHGSPEEAEALNTVLSRNCDCDYETDGRRVRTCGGHDMLLNDQRALDGLMFGRRLQDRLEAEEWMRVE